MKDITKEEAQKLREMARLAFRNSIGATEDDAVAFNYKDYSTLDLNFLWHFKSLVEVYEREACAKVCDDIDKHFEYTIAARQCAAVIRARGEK